MNALAPRASFGEWIVEEPLGRGGMGVVYRARHRQDGRAAALKTVSTPDTALLESIRREIHALAGIHHPGIVRILDEGVANGIPWYAMELLDGVSLRRHVLGEPAGAAPGGAEAGDGAWWTTRLLPSHSAIPADETRSVVPRRGNEPLPLHRAVSVVRRLCAPLAYLHGEGIVHRDLKPANVLVRPDGMPVLLDFGLVSRFTASSSREVLELEGVAVGTVAYMAPEQGEGRLVDARADLYALGCILYELVTGQPPFSGESPYETLQKRYRTAPSPPSAVVPGVPAALDQLVARMLARDPRRRVGHAEDVARSLAALGAENGSAATTSPRPRAYLYRPGFAGREEILSQLADRLAMLHESEGGIVLLRGESGIGKTRLAAAAAGEATAFRVDVMTGECMPTAGGAGREALGALQRPLQTLVDRCRAGGIEATAHVFGPRGPVLAPLHPAIASLPGQAQEPRPAELEPAAARARVLDCLEDTLLTVAADRPLLLVLDDLQWADDLTLALLQKMASGGRLSGAKLLLLGTYRADEAGPAVQALARSPGVVDLLVEPLHEGAVADIAGSMLAIDDPPSAFVRFLTAHAEGNPFFVAEYLRVALAEGVLSRDAEGTWQVAASGGWETLPDPGSIRDLVARRLDRLSPDGSWLARVAAVLGRESEPAVLRAAAALPPETSLRAEAELLARLVLEEPRPGALRFVHDRIREAAYDATPRAQRPALHLAAARALDAHASGTPDERMAVLGHHWEHAGDLDRARHCYLGAARRALRTYAADEAERLLRAYLRLVHAPTPESIAARNLLGREVLATRRRPEEALAEHELALAESRQIGDSRGEAESVHWIGKAFMAMGDLPKAGERLREAEVLQRAQGDRERLAHVLVDAGNFCRRSGNMAGARRAYEEAAEINRELGDPKLEGMALASLGVLAFEEARFSDAEELYARAIERHRASGDLGNEVLSLGSLSAVLHDQGRIHDAEAKCAEAIELNRRVGDRRSQAQLLANLASMRLERGEPTAARPLFAEAVALARDVGNRRIEAYAMGNLALCDLEDDRAEEARVSLREAVRILEAVGDLRLLGFSLDNLARAELALGKSDEADKTYRRALEVHRQAGDRHGEAVSLLGIAAVSRIAGDPAACAPVLADVDAIAAEIADVRLEALAHVERGHVAMAEGRDPRKHLAAARAAAERLQDSPGSRLARSIDALAAAADGWRRGSPRRKIPHGKPRGAPR